MKNIEIIKKLTSIEEMLKELQGGSMEIYNIEQATEFLSIKKSYLYRLTHEKKISYFTTGKKIYFAKIDLLNYLTKNRIEAVN